MGMRLLFVVLLALLSTICVNGGRAKSLERSLLEVSSGRNSTAAPDSDELQAEHGAQPGRNGTASRPVIGWADSDVEVLHPAPDSNRMGKIVGGEDADHKKHPYQLQLAMNGDQMCGATVISRWWAVTAAHCLMDAEGEQVATRWVTLRAGATRLNTGGRVHTVSKAIVHKQFNNEEYDYDIALLKVNVPFEFGPRVQKIALLPIGQGVPEGTMGVVTGWGYRDNHGEQSLTLQNVALPVVSHRKCRTSYRRRRLLVTDRMLCAGFPKRRRDFCQGDSGGPLVVDGTLVGIVSWSLGCAIPGYPGVFTRMSKFRTWIKSTSGV